MATTHTRVVPLTHMVTAKLLALKNDMAAVKPTECTTAKGDSMPLMLIAPNRFQQWVKTIETLVESATAELPPAA